MLRASLPHTVEAEADVVRMLFRRYLEIGSVVRALASRGWRSIPHGSALSIGRPRNEPSGLLRFGLEVNRTINNQSECIRRRRFQLVGLHTSEI